MLVLEGARLVRDAVSSGLALDFALVAEGGAEALDLERELARPEVAGPEGVALVDAELLARVSGLKSGADVVALARAPELQDVGALEVAGEDLVLVVDGVQDPANLGALVRSAEAAGAAAVVHVRGGASPQHPRVLRGSMGSALRLPAFVAADRAAAGAALGALGMRVVRPDTRGGTDWRAMDWSGPLALWIGGEVAPADVAGEGVTIPMGGRVESLNVTVAAALLLFAAGRAR